MPGGPLELWTARQRRALVAVCGGAIVVLGVLLIINQTTVPDPQPAEGKLSGQLADRIDPNVASVAELAAIPSLGEKRAEAIVEFRSGAQGRHPGRVIFGRLEDLLGVKGIGAATAENLEPYLVFPNASSTRP